MCGCAPRRRDTGPVAHSAETVRLVATGDRRCPERYPVPRQPSEVFARRMTRAPDRYTRPALCMPLRRGYVTGPGYHQRALAISVLTLFSQSRMLSDKV